MYIKLTVCPWIFSAAPRVQINVCVSSKTTFDLSLPSKTAITSLLILSVLSHAVVMIDDTYFLFHCCYYSYMVNWNIASLPTWSWYSNQLNCKCALRGCSFAISKVKSVKLSKLFKGRWSTGACKAKVKSSSHYPC